ncbi:MAG: hypothetical protein IJ043_08215 [Clostridia bacterium]|nr:hypothetical protein [Clostridia bacterium]
MSKKDKRPSYFCFFIEACNMISLLEVESAGRVIHAVSDYFADGVAPNNLDRKEMTVFNRIQRDMDMSYELYRKKVEGGKKGAEIRYRANDD